jgi:hypothetical protein
MVPPGAVYDAPRVLQARDCGRERRGARGRRVRGPWIACIVNICMREAPRCHTRMRCVLCLRVTSALLGSLTRAVPATDSSVLVRRVYDRDVLRLSHHGGHTKGARTFALSLARSLARSRARPQSRPRPQCVMGLNETALGIVAPDWLAGQYVHTLGPRAADMHLQRGTLLTPAAALRAGLVDELVTGDVVAPALAVARAWGRVPATARAASKAFSHGPLIASLSTPALRAADCARWLAAISEPAAAAALKAYVEGLSKRRA